MKDIINRLLRKNAERARDLVARRNSLVLDLRQQLKAWEDSPRGLHGQDLYTVFDKITLVEREWVAVDEIALHLEGLLFETMKVSVSKEDISRTYGVPVSLLE